MYIPFLIPGLVTLVRTVAGRIHGEPAPQPKPDLAQELDEAELSALQGEWDTCRAKLSGTAKYLEVEDSTISPLLRARHWILGGDLLAEAGQLNGAAERFTRALAIADSLPGQQNTVDLRLRARIGQAALELRHAVQPDAFAGATELIARHGETRNGAIWVRLARLAKLLAEIRHERGDWPGARSDFESAVRIGEQVPEPGTLQPGVFYEPLDRARVLYRSGRATASRAASSIGFTLCTSGDRDAGLVWLDRAVALLGNLDDPESRTLRAWTLSARAAEDIEDPVLGAPVRRRALEHALEEGVAAGIPAGLGVACRAALALAKEHIERGDMQAAELQLSRADELLQGTTANGATELRAKVLLEQGLLLRGADRFDRALERFCLADTLGRADTDAAARSLAFQGACHAHALLIAAGRLDDARDLLAGLDARVPALPPPDRERALIMIGQARAAQYFQDGKPQDAATALAAVEARVARAKGDTLASVMRNVIADQGRVALVEDRGQDAMVFFLRALEIGTIGEPPASNDLFRAEVTLDLARAYLVLDREADAREALERVFDLGRRSGGSSGRACAAVAALNLALANEDSPDQRRDWLQAAVRFGQLSGLARGLDAARQAEELLRGGLPG